MQSPVPALVHSLTALSKILDKAEAFAEAKKMKPDVIPQLRLIADMLPFWRQIAIATDHAKGMSARLAGVDVPSFEDTETTVAELKARIAKTIAFISSIPADAYEGAESRMVAIKVGGRDLTFPGGQYYAGYAIPNFYFHMTTAYDILRSNGVEVGKTDFLGG
ncbi:MAG: DUF1993 domain-containing protein [bacterium]